MFKYSGSLSRHLNTEHSAYEKLGMIEVHPGPIREGHPSLNSTPYDPDAPFNCETCMKTYLSKSSLQHHIETKHGNMSYNCPKCTRVFSLKSSLAKHIRNEVCGPGRVEDLKDLKKTAQVVLNDEEDFAAPKENLGEKCEFCDVILASTKDKHKHNRDAHVDPADPEKFLCPKCPKTFKTISQLRSHLHSSIHSDVKNYQCDICSKQFAAATNLRKHVNTVHHDIKNFKCPECDFRADSRRGIKEHYEPVHLGRRDHQCLVCLQAFSKRCHLLRHKRLQGH